MNYRTIEACRVCGNLELTPIISLGDQYISDFYDNKDHNADAAPLELILCSPKNNGCGLLQLKHTVPRNRMYEQYWYRSGINQTMCNALADITKSAEQLVSLKDNDIVIDIGSNDSTLLRSYKKSNLELVGFEPSKNLIEYAKVSKGKIINDFFNYDSFSKEYANSKAKVITSIAMFYDLDEPNKFVEDIRKCLDQNGVWIIQMNYLAIMLEQNAFDNISHEHLEYYSLYSLEQLLKRHNLEVFDVELNNINGGSYRIFIQHKTSEKRNLVEANERLDNVRKKETEMKLDEIEIYKNFSNSIEKLKQDTMEFIKKEIEMKKTVYIYGASTRGNVLLQYYGLNEKFIKAAAERNPDKWGKYIVGTSIPIISEEDARKEIPDYFLVLPWAFLQEFLQREEKFLQNGGKFIVPLPILEIIDKNFGK